MDLCRTGVQFGILVMTSVGIPCYCKSITPPPPPHTPTPTQGFDCSYVCVEYDISRGWLYYLPFKSDWKFFVSAGFWGQCERTLFLNAFFGNDSFSVSTCMILFWAPFCAMAASRQSRKLFVLAERLSQTKHNKSCAWNLLNILVTPPWINSKGVTGMIFKSKSPSMADITLCTLHFFPPAAQFPGQSFNTYNLYALVLFTFFSST